jgi:predicted DNA-binding protein with PD1-like motif
VKRTPVTSSNIMSVGYDPASQTLEVAYATGIYQYAEVPPEVHLNLMTAGSKGRYLAAHVKPHYAATKVPDTETGQGES